MTTIRAFRSASLCPVLVSRGIAENRSSRLAGDGHPLRKLSPQIKAWAMGSSGLRLIAWRGHKNHPIDSQSVDNSIKPLTADMRFYYSSIIRDRPIGSRWCRAGRGYDGPYFGSGARTVRDLTQPLEYYQVDLNGLWIQPQRLRFDLWSEVEGLLLLTYRQAHVGTDTGCSAKHSRSDLKAVV